MKLVNILVFSTLVLGLFVSAACLVGVAADNVTLDTLVCPVLGPGMLVAALGSLAAVAMLAIGIAIRLLDGDVRLWPSLFVVNALIALLVPVALMV